MEHTSTPENAQHAPPGDTNRRFNTTDPGSVGQTTVVNGSDYKEGVGSAPVFGSILALLSMIILGLSAPLYAYFKEGAADYILELSRVYLYNLIVSAFGIFAGVLISLRIYRRVNILVIMLLFALLYTAGFGWTVHRYRRIARFVSHSRVSTALVVFLGFAGFGGLLGFFYELYRYHRGRKSSDSGLHEIKKRHLV